MRRMMHDLGVKRVQRKQEGERDGKSSEEGRGSQGHGLLHGHASEDHDHAIRRLVRTGALSTSVTAQPARASACVTDCSQMAEPSMRFRSMSP